MKDIDSGLFNQKLTWFINLCTHFGDGLIFLVIALKKKRMSFNLPLFTFCPPGPLLRTKVNVIKSKNQLFGMIILDENI